MKDHYAGVDMDLCRKGDLGETQKLVVALTGQIKDIAWSIRTAAGLLEVDPEGDYRDEVIASLRTLAWQLDGGSGGEYTGSVEEAPREPSVSEGDPSSDDSNG